MLADEAVPARAWAALLVGSATVVLVVLDAGFIALAFPEIEAEFDDSSRATLGWVFSGYFIALAGFMLFAGWVADRVGRRRVFFAGLGVFALGAALTAIAPTTGTLIGARVIQGTGAAALTPVSLAMVLPLFPTSRRATAVGAWAVAGSVAAIVSATLGAALIQVAGWRAPFLLFVPVSLVAWLVGRRVLPEGTRDVASPVDAIGIVVTTTVVAAGAVVVSQGDDWGWTSPPLLVAVAFVAAGFPFLIRRARRRPGSLLDVTLFSIRSYSTATVVSMLGQAAYFAFLFSLPLFLIDVWGWSTIQAGSAIALNALASASVGLPAGRWADRHGHVGVIVSGGVIAAIGYGWLALGATADPDVGSLLVPTLIVGGVGSVMVGGTISAAAFHDVDDVSLGRASAAYYVTRRLGSAMGAVAAVAILGDAVGDAALDNFRRIFAFSAGCYLTAAVVMAVLFDGAVTAPRDRAG